MKHILKKTIVHLSILFVLFFIDYLIHAFIAADFNIGNWSEIVRVSTILIMTIVIIFYLLIQID